VCQSSPPKHWNVRDLRIKVWVSVTLLRIDELVLQLRKWPNSAYIVGTKLTFPLVCFNFSCSRFCNYCHFFDICCWTLFSSSALIILRAIYCPKKKYNGDGDENRMRDRESCGCGAGNYCKNAVNATHASSWSRNNGWRTQNSGKRWTDRFL